VRVGEQVLRRPGEEQVTADRKPPLAEQTSGREQAYGICMAHARRVPGQQLVVEPVEPPVRNDLGLVAGLALVVSKLPPLHEGEPSRVVTETQVDLVSDGRVHHTARTHVEHQQVIRASTRSDAVHQAGCRPYGRQDEIHACLHQDVTVHRVGIGAVHGALAQADHDRAAVRVRHGDQSVRQFLRGDQRALSLEPLTLRHGDQPAPHHVRR